MKIKRQLEKNRKLHRKYKSLREIAAYTTDSSDYTIIQCASCRLWYKRPPWYLEEGHSFECCIEDFCNDCIGDSVYDCHAPLYVCPKCKKCEICEKCGLDPDRDLY